MILTMSFNEAIKTESNLGIVSALLTGTLVLSLYASFFVYNEPITKIQASGSVFLFIGNSTLALFYKPVKNPSRQRYYGSVCINRNDVLLYPSADIQENLHCDRDSTVHSGQLRDAR